MNEQNNKPQNMGKPQNHHGNRDRRRGNRNKPYYMNEKPKNAEGQDHALSQKPEQAQPSQKNDRNVEKNKQEQNQQNRPQTHQGQERRNRNRNRNRNRHPDKHREEQPLQKLEKESLLLNSGATEESILSPVGEYEPDPMISDDNTPEISISIEAPEIEEPTVTVSGIRFKAGGKVYYFDSGELELKNSSYVIVETARGTEFGEVAFAAKKIRESSIVLPLRPVVRLATEADIAHHKENKRLEEEAFGICLEKIAKHKLDMKLIEAQYSFDNSKLLFYFTSASRVDFRELVKDLASVFKTRIELRQIGIRDEAKIIGGLGACGRSLCCSSFLSDFVQVSIKMAKEQNLSLNSGKISGVCGRLMCCLQYEYSTYLDEASRTPPVDATVKTKDGIGYVTEVIPLAGKIKVQLKDKPDSPPQYYHRDEVTVISRSVKKDND